MMKAILMTLTLGFGVTGAFAAQPASQPNINTEHEAAFVAQQLVTQDPFLDYQAVKQEVLLKLEKPHLKGACCEAWYDGKKVKGTRMGAHGHAVCVPNQPCF